MKHFVVVQNWASGYDSDSDVAGVAHTLEKAKEIFAGIAKTEKKFAKDSGYTIYEDSDVLFDAGKEGYYIEDHTKVYIQEV